MTVLLMDERRMRRCSPPRPGIKGVVNGRLNAVFIALWLQRPNALPICSLHAVEAFGLESQARAPEDYQQSPPTR